MKRGFRSCWLIIVMAVGSYSVRGQSAADTLGFEGFKVERLMPDKGNVVRLAGIPLLVGQIPYCGELRITYERVLAARHSLILGGAYNYPNIFLLLFGANSGAGFRDISIRGGRVMAGYRLYPLKSQTAPEGFFIGPFFSYNYAKIKEKSGYYSYNELSYLNATLVCGYQIRMGDMGFADFMGGLGYRYNVTTRYDGRTKQLTSREEYTIRFLKNAKLFLQINVGVGF